MIAVTTHRRPGYVFLVSVLAVGAICTLIVAVLLLLSTTIARSTISLEQSARAFAYANTCIERALLALHNDVNYAGNVTVAFELGTCTVQPIGGFGNADRIVCVEGQSGTVARHFEITIGRILPSHRIASWQEVAVLTACDS